MSHHLSPRELHDAHEDNRIQAVSRSRALAREAETKRILDERHARRMWPCLNSNSRTSDDFDGCVE